MILPLVIVLAMKSIYPAKQSTPSPIWRGALRDVVVGVLLRRIKIAGHLGVEDNRVPLLSNPNPIRALLCPFTIGIFATPFRVRHGRSPAVVLRCRPTLVASGPARGVRPLRPFWLRIPLPPGNDG